MSGSLLDARSAGMKHDATAMRAEQQRQRDEHDRIRRTHVVEQRRHPSCRDERADHTDSNADRRDYRAFPQYQSDERARLGADGEPNAEFPPAIGDESDITP